MPLHSAIAKTSTFQSFRANKQQQKDLLAAAAERYGNIAGRKEVWEDYGYLNINMWYVDLFRAKDELKAAKARYTNACRKIRGFTLAAIINEREGGETDDES